MRCQIRPDSFHLSLLGHFPDRHFERSSDVCISLLVLNTSCLPGANIAFILFIECKHKVFGQFSGLNLALANV